MTKSRNWHSRQQKDFSQNSFFLCKNLSILFMVRESCDEHFNYFWQNCKRHLLQLQFILKLIKSSTWVNSMKQVREKSDGDDERWRRRSELIHYRNCWRRQRASREVLKSFSFPRSFFFKEKSLRIVLRISFRRRRRRVISFRYIRHRVFTIPLLLSVRFYCVCLREILNLKIQQQNSRLL